MKIEKLPEGRFRISDGTRNIEFDKASYEDLFYAVPLDSTALYRLLTEAVCRTDEERNTMVAMIEGQGDMEAGLNDLQDQITKIEP
ncbi:MAG: hypothetical protein ACYTHM_08340 [Planctomycetota bacterium]|jgi:hypothetical protein